MRTLEALDYAVIVAYLAISMLAGLVVSRSAGNSMKDFFLSGRSLPWWLAGVSMAATNFSIDTPLAITKYVAEHGVAGVWFFWSNAVSALLAAFLFSRLWSRAAVVTDAELIELRYSGPSAAGLRLFKGFYFGLFVNCYVLGWVLKAVIKVTAGVTDLPVYWMLAICVVVALAYTLASGLKGVVWTDFFQYGVGVVGSILLAVYALDRVGGADGLMEKLAEMFGDATPLTQFFPTAAATAESPGLVAAAARGFEFAAMPVSVILVYVGVQWWAYKYSDGGGKHIQRMLACRNEQHARGATLFFAMMNYAVQVWPWIITALCSLVIFGALDDPEMGYPRLMAELLPTGLLGLLVVTMLGAFMSTVDTHLNLGAAYFVNDLYKRFLRPDASERHYVFVSRAAMIGLLLVGVAIALSIDSIGDAWKFILAFSSGAGLTWILRWFWWRVNAWTEISAMATSGVLAIYLRLAHDDWSYPARLMTVIGVSTVVWLAVTFLTRPTDDDTLAAFLRRVRPGSPGWRRIYVKYGIEPEAFLGRGLVDWAVGLVTFLSANFGIGAALLGDWVTSAALGAVAAVAGVVLFLRLRGR